MCIFAEPNKGDPKFSHPYLLTLFANGFESDLGNGPFRKYVRSNIAFLNPFPPLVRFCSFSVANVHIGLFRNTCPYVLLDCERTNQDEKINEPIVEFRKIEKHVRWK